MIRIHSCDSNLQRRDILASGHLQKKYLPQAFVFRSGMGLARRKIFLCLDKGLGRDVDFIQYSTSAEFSFGVSG